MAKRRTWVLLAAAGAAALAAVIWLAWPAPPQTAEERIRAALEQAARAAEERKVGEVAELLSERFRGGAGREGGGLGRDDARRLLALELLRGRWVSVSLPSIELAVDGGWARANVDALLSRAADRGKGLAALLPGEASVHRFELELEEEPDGRWRVVAATWRPVDLAAALEGPGKPGW